MSRPFQPLLASPVDFDKLRFGDIGLSVKLDGIRAVVIDGVVMSRKLKPIPNKHVQRLFGHLEHYDGELICGEPTSPSCYRDTASAVMSIEGEPKVTFHAFDHIKYPDADYLTRYEQLEESGDVVVVMQHQVCSVKDIESLENVLLGLGYEGVMLRKLRGPDSLYKFGRATAKSNTLLKLKRFMDAEYKVVGFVERMHNANEAKTNAIGRTERSSHAENMVPTNTLGALILEHPAGSFTCGTGFTDAERKHIWDNRELFIGRLAKVKSFAIGVKDLPRFPVWLGFREEMDM